MKLKERFFQFIEDKKKKEEDRENIDIIVEHLCVNHSIKMNIIDDKGNFVPQKLDEGPGFLDLTTVDEKAVSYYKQAKEIANNSKYWFVGIGFFYPENPLLMLGKSIVLKNQRG